jgi:aryl-alcohol dehydrogenase-like predicted oxidoreductase
MPSTPLETLTLADDLTITRMGFGAMQLAGPGVFGPPKDRQEAIAVLREAVDLGITHIDTSDFYGPVVTNEIIREALYPYPADVRIFTKVGARRGADASWNPSLEPGDLRAQVHENLDHLGVDVLDVVYLRWRAHETTSDDPIGEEFGVLADLQRQGLIRHLGLSGVSAVQLTEAKTVAPVVAIQNLYNLVSRQDDALVDRAARENIAYVSFFPLGGFTPLQSDVLSAVAERMDASPQQIALAWLLQRSDTSVVIPGTSSRAHLRENTAAAGLELPLDAIKELDAIAIAAGRP